MALAAIGVDLQNLGPGAAAAGTLGISGNVVT